MAKLNREELAFLDFLCAVAHQRCRVTRVKAKCQPALRSLRFAGLVSFDGFAPSPWALADWRRRKGHDPLLEDPQTPDPFRIPDPADSPEPKASEDGGGASARNSAPPPHSKRPFLSFDERDARFQASKTAPAKAGRPRPDGAMCGADLAAEIDAFLASDRGKGLSQHRIGWHLFKSPSGIGKLRNRKWITDATVARVRAFIADPDPAAWSSSYFKTRKAEPEAVHSAENYSEIISEPPAIAEPPHPHADNDDRDAESSAEPLANELEAEAAPPVAPVARPQRRDPTQPPEGYQTRPGAIDLTEAVIQAAQAKGDVKRKGIMAAAQKRIDAGLGIAGRGAPAGIKIAQAALENQMAEEARLACPIEQAKTKLRRRHAPVIGAEIREGPSGKGFYIVGQRRVDEAELLAMAAAA